MYNTMTKKEFLLWLLSKIQHPDDPTNDILLWLQTLLNQWDVTDEMVQTMEDMLIMIMKVSQQQEAQQKYQQAQDLLSQIRKSESNSDDVVDHDLEQQLLSL